MSQADQPNLSAIVDELDDFDCQGEVYFTAVSIDKEINVKSKVLGSFKDVGEARAALRAVIEERDSLSETLAAALKELERVKGLAKTS